MEERYEKIFLKTLIENEDNGIIFLDQNGILIEINKAGQKIVGLAVDDVHPHPAGRIKKGDIVIICDTEIGGDDGELEPKDLKIIGINDKKIQKGAAIVAIGEFDTGKKAIYKFKSRDTYGTELKLTEQVMGKTVTATIDEKNRLVEITVNGECIKENYIENYGHFVILDGSTGDIKFLQAKGYSIRKEYIKNILYGAEYASKERELTTDVINSTFDSVFHESNCIEDLKKILSGNTERIENRIYEINHRPLAISMLPVRSTDTLPSGVIIKIAEIASLEKALKSRNELLSVLENKRKEIYAVGEEEEDNYFGDVLGNGIEMREVKALARRAAKRKINVLITGESGTGKSFLAREIYKAAGSSGPFIYVNCASISPNLFESEMFGYVGGAFTGANAKGRTGYFESANGGTIFLDEIGELPMTIQVKLLNVIQNKEICRVGSAKVIPVNVRIIAATNLDLEKEVEKGNFRKDLFYRLNVFNIEMPPLRKCKEDIAFMAQKFLDNACRNNEIEGKILSQDAIYKLSSYDWPGNIRQLQNTIERASVFCDDSIIYPEYIKISSETQKTDLKTHLKIEEKRMIEETIRSFNGDKIKAMKSLGLSKSVFYSKLKEYDVK